MQAFTVYATIPPDVQSARSSSIDYRSLEFAAPEVIAVDRHLEHLHVGESVSLIIKIIIYIIWSSRNELTTKNV